MRALSLLVVLLLAPVALGAAPPRIVEDETAGTREGILRVDGRSAWAGSYRTECAPGNGWGCTLPGAGAGQTTFSFTTDARNRTWSDETPEDLCGTASYGRSMRYVGAGLGGASSHSIGTRACVTAGEDSFHLWSVDEVGSQWRVDVLVTVFKDAPRGPCHDGASAFGAPVGIHGTIGGQLVDMTGTVAGALPC